MERETKSDRAPRNASAPITTERERTSPALTPELPSPLAPGGTRWLSSSRGAPAMFPRLLNAEAHHCPVELRHCPVTTRTRRRIWSLPPCHPGLHAGFHHCPAATRTRQTPPLPRCHPGLFAILRRCPIATRTRRRNSALPRHHQDSTPNPVTAPTPPGLDAKLHHCPVVTHSQTPTNVSINRFSRCPLSRDQTHVTGCSAFKHPLRSQPSFLHDSMALYDEQSHW